MFSPVETSCILTKKWWDSREITFLRSRWPKQVRISLLPYPHSYFLQTWALSESLQACCVQPGALLVQDEWVPLHRHAHREQEISNRLDLGFFPLPLFSAYSKNAVRCNWGTWRNSLRAHQYAADYSQQWHIPQSIYSTKAHGVGFYIVGAWMIQCWGNYTAVGLRSPSVSEHLSLQRIRMERILLVLCRPGAERRIMYGGYCMVEVPGTL